MSKLKRKYVEGNISNINPVLAEIIYSRTVKGAAGNIRDLSQEISRQEIYFILDILNEVEPLRAVLEIGCAYGVSSIVIAHVLASRTNKPTYVILDPYQSTHYDNIGANNIRAAGFDLFELREVGSETALPQMMTDVVKYDLIFQDGMKAMDHVMLEFHYLNRLLRVGGVLIYDDVDRWQMNKFIRYISLYPHWEIIASAGDRAQSFGRKALSLVKSVLCPWLSLLPRTLALEFLSDTVLRSDKSLGLDASMIALRKVGEDTRHYSWNAKF